MTVDATTGQNGVRQAKLFGEAVGVTGIVLTKLDGTAKGGIALAIANELGIPVKLIGIGESLEDLRPVRRRRLRPRAADLSGWPPIASASHRVGGLGDAGVRRWSLGPVAGRAALLGVGEILTTGFFLAPFAGGALVAAVLSAVGARHRDQPRLVPRRLGAAARRPAADRARAPAHAGRACGRARPRWSGKTADGGRADRQRRGRGHGAPRRRGRGRRAPTTRTP